MSLEERREARRARILHNAENRLKRIAMWHEQDHDAKQLDNGISTAVSSETTRCDNQSTVDSVMPSSVRSQGSAGKISKEARRKSISTERLASSTEFASIYNAQSSRVLFDSANFPVEPPAVSRRVRLFRFLAIVALAFVIRLINFVLEYVKATWYIDQIFMPLFALLLAELIVYPMPVKLSRTLRLGIALYGWNERQIKIANLIVTRILCVFKDVTIYFFVYAGLGMLLAFCFDV